MNSKASLSYTAKPNQKENLKNEISHDVLRPEARLTVHAGQNKCTCTQHTQNTKTIGTWFLMPSCKNGTLKYLPFYLRVFNIINQVRNDPELSRLHGAQLPRAPCFCPCLR